LVLFGVAGGLAGRRLTSSEGFFFFTSSDDDDDEVDVGIGPMDDTGILVVVSGGSGLCRLGTFRDGLLLQRLCFSTSDGGSA
jgi:hypothetical protein